MASSVKELFESVVRSQVSGTKFFVPFDWAADGIFIERERRTLTGRKLPQSVWVYFRMAPYDYSAGDFSSAKSYRQTPNDSMRMELLGRLWRQASQNMVSQYLFPADREIHVLWLRSQGVYPPHRNWTQAHVWSYRQSLAEASGTFDHVYVGLNLLPDTPPSIKDAFLTSDFARLFGMPSMPPSLQPYETDLRRVQESAQRAGLHPIGDGDIHRMLTLGAGFSADERPRIVVPDSQPQSLIVNDNRRLEFVALTRAERNGMFASAIMERMDGAGGFSLRGRLADPAQLASKLRKSRSTAKVNAQNSISDDTAATDEGEISKYHTLEVAQQQLKDAIVDGVPYVFDTEFVSFSEAPLEEDEYLTYRNSKDFESAPDMMARVFGHQWSELRGRQLAAYESALPCGRRSVGLKAANHIVSLDGVTAIGIGNSPEFGDTQTGTAIMVGMKTRNHQPLFFDYAAAKRVHSKAPYMEVIAGSGSGKTVTVAWWCDSWVRQGTPVVFLNLKEGPTRLDGLARATNANRVFVGDSERGRTGGTLDPFFWAANHDAVLRYAMMLFKAVLGDMFDSRAYSDLRAALGKAAANGAGCLGRALEMASRESAALNEIVERINIERATRSEIAMAISDVPKEDREGDDTMTLIEVVGGLSSSTDDLAMTIKSFLVMSSFKRLETLGEGVMVIDESHVFLNNPEIVEMLQYIIQTARSLGLFIILMNQKASQFKGADRMSSHGQAGGASDDDYGASYYVLMANDGKDAVEALERAEIPVTPRTTGFLASAKPAIDSTGSSHPPKMLFRDANTKGGVRVGMAFAGPVPDELLDSLVTHH